MTLKVRAVGVAPGAASDVVDIAWGADGHDECGCLIVVELFNVASKDVNHGAGDARETYTLDITFFNSASNLFL